jgi:hypothetical protein
MSTSAADDAGAGSPGWWNHCWRGLTARWCREFHRCWHQRFPLDEDRAKVICARCQRKFLRQRHRCYLVH